MSTPQLSEGQKKFFEFQKNLKETVTSENNLISVSFNGMLEITSLEIAPGTDSDKINDLLMETINKGIKITSQKIQSAIMELQKTIQPQFNR